MYWIFSLMLLDLSAHVPVGKASIGAALDNSTERKVVPLTEKYDLVKLNFKPEMSENENNLTNILMGRRDSVRIKRSNYEHPFAPPAYVCDVTEGELSGLADVLQRATSQLFQPSNQSVTRSTGSRCSALITRITTKASYIITQIKLIKHKELREVLQFEILKIKLIGQLSQFNRMVDNLKKGHHQTMPPVIENFNAKLTAFQRQVNDLVTRKLNPQAESRAESIKLCVFHIKSGEASLAADEFKKLNDHFLLRGITKDAYSGNPENVPKIVAFVRKLPSCSQDKAAYLVLYAEMKRYDHLSSPEILTFADAISRSCSNELEDINAKLNPLVDNIISSWADRVRSGDIHKIIEFARRQATTYVMDSNLPNLIRTSYSTNLSNFDAVLAFIDDLPGYTQRHRGFDTLLTEMKKNSNHLYSDKILRLAYKVKKAMTLSNFTNLTVETRNSYYKLKNAFPDKIAGLIWNGDECAIINYKHSENMYAANNFYNFNTNSRRVLTWVEGMSVFGGRWKFETDDGAVSFRIKNTLYNEYLFASSHYTRDSERRWVFTWRSGAAVDQGDWKITPVDSATFTIKNSWHDEYLYADGNMHYGYGWKEKRGVFTWRLGTPGGVMLQESKWIISC